MTFLSVAVASHVGQVRSRNEDALGLNGWLLSTRDAGPLSFDFDLSRHSDPAFESRQGTASAAEDAWTLSPEDAEVVIVLADGMGGHAAGDTAAALTAQLASRTGHLRVPDDVARRIAEVDAAVAAAAREDAAREGMGSTAVGLAARGERVLIFNVGDSRAYRLDGGYLGQLSVDDRQGEEDGGMLTAAIGLQSGQPDPHVTALPANLEARYLLCSDGLWDVVGEDEIERVLAIGPARKAARLLIETALRWGAPDNVSAAVIDTRP